MKKEKQVVKKKMKKVYLMWKDVWCRWERKTWFSASTCSWIVLCGCVSEVLKCNYFGNNKLVSHLGDKKKGV